MNKETLYRRSMMNRSIREFFIDRDHLEVETPVLSETLIPEPSIENFATEFSSEFHHRRELYLIPSPEIHMKMLLSEGYGSLFQISRCFRNSEQIGTIHNPEFSMLEWYTVDADYLDSIELTEQLLGHLTDQHSPDHCRPPFRRMRMADAFWKYLHLDLDRLQDLRSIRAASAAAGLVPSASGASWEDEFNRLFLTFIEPEIPQDRPLVITDYPQQIAALAKRKPGSPYRERWELYIGGIELANCYSEEEDPEKVRDFFRREYALLTAQRAVTGSVIPDIDPEYFRYFEGSFPRCSGTAMGLDRLFMAITGIKTIQGVILFPFSDKI